MSERTYCQDPEHIALPPTAGSYCSGPHTSWSSTVAECPERAQHYLMSHCGTCGYPNGGKWQKTVTAVRSDSPACAACDRPVEVLPSGVMVHPDGAGHEEWPNGRGQTRDPQA